MTLSFGNYTGGVSCRFDVPSVRLQLSNIDDLLTDECASVLSLGQDRVLKSRLFLEDQQVEVAVKVFSRQTLLKDWFDRKNKSKAERSFAAAQYLYDHDLGTPEPIAWMDHWSQGRLLGSYYLCTYLEAPSFRDALVNIYRQQRDNAPLIALLHKVAPAIRALHDNGFMHGDMGNQNILIPKSENGEWMAPRFIDLNRSQRFAGPLTEVKRAHDLCRVALPGAYLEIFKMIYSGHEVFPAPLAALEGKARQRFWRHRRNSQWRHPVRTLKKWVQQTPSSPYPSDADLWLWDEKSAQPMIALGPAEKRRQRDLSDIAAMLLRGLWAAPGLFLRYQKIKALSFTRPVELKQRIGVALHPDPDYIKPELKLLHALGNPPTLVRFCHHETPAQWTAAVELVQRLKSRSIPVMAALLQDREAVLNPDAWREFLFTVIPLIADSVDRVEITHAANRSKWGIWKSRSFAQLMGPVRALKDRYPDLEFVGPACIDFEYLPVLASLAVLPKGLTFSGLSHLLYVDRRGAPENKQGAFSTLEKSILLKAIADGSRAVENRVIVSEVNWPLKNAGVWSPIMCPYETPAWRIEKLGVTETEYAHFMLRYLALTLCSGHVEMVYWWRLSAHGYGLVDDLNDFAPRPAFTALAFFLELFGEARFELRHQTESDTYVLEFSKAGDRYLMAWCVSGEAQLRFDGLSSGGWCVDQAWRFDGTLITESTVSESPTYYRLVPSG
jgi:hypothetical protein